VEHPGENGVWLHMNGKNAVRPAFLGCHRAGKKSEPKGVGYSRRAPRRPSQAVMEARRARGGKAAEVLDRGLAAKRTWGSGVRARRGQEPEKRVGDCGEGKRWGGRISSSSKEVDRKKREVPEEGQRNGRVRKLISEVELEKQVASEAKRLWPPQDASFKDARLGAPERGDAQEKKQQQQKKGKKPRFLAKKLREAHQSRGGQQVEKSQSVREKSNPREKTRDPPGPCSLSPERAGRKSPLLFAEPCQNLCLHLLIKKITDRKGEAKAVPSGNNSQQIKTGVSGEVPTNAQSNLRTNEVPWGESQRSEKKNRVKMQDKSNQSIKTPSPELLNRPNKKVPNVVPGGPQKKPPGRTRGRAWS